MMGDQDRCLWPLGACACAEMEAQKNSGPDRMGRVWMHCEEGLSLTKASMGRFMVFCLSNGVEIGDVWPFAPRFPRSAVIVSIRLRPDQFSAFEAETGGKLREPPVIKLNSAEQSDAAP